MKSLLSSIVVAILVSTVSAQETKLVVTTSPILQDIARQIGGDVFRVENLVPSGTRTEDFEPGIEATNLLRSAAILLVNGADYEPWLADFTKNAGFTGVLCVATTNVPLLDLQGNMHRINNDGTLESPDADFDPYAWHNPKNVAQYVENIRFAMVDVEPTQRGAINLRAAGYLKLLESLNTYAEQQFASLPANRRTMATPHAAFNYLADKYGLRIVPIVGVASGRDLLPEQQARLIEMINRLRVPAVFFERTANARMMSHFASETGVKMITSLYTDNLGPPGTLAATYLGMIRTNVDAIVSALKPAPAPAPAAGAASAPAPKASVPAGK